MQTTFRAASTAQATTGTAVSLSAPTGTTVGDLVLVVVNANNVTTVVDNNGSTPFTEDLNDFPQPTTGQTVSIFSRRIQSGDPSTYNFTIGTSGRWRVNALAIAAPNPNVIYEFPPVGVAGTSGTATICDTPPSVTKRPFSLIYQVFCPDAASQVFSNPPSGYTQRASTSGTGQCTAIYELIKTSPGIEPQRRISYDVNNACVGVVFAIRSIQSVYGLPGVSPYRALLKIG